MERHIASAVVVGSRGVPVRVRAALGVGPTGAGGRPDESTRRLAARVGAALSSSGLGPPGAEVSLDVDGAPWCDGLELAAAVAVLVAAGVVGPEATAGVSFVAGLGLDGSVRPVPGALPRVEAVQAPTVVVARANVAEAALAAGRRVVSVDGLRQLAGMLAGAPAWPAPVPPPPSAAPAGVAHPRALDGMIPSVRTALVVAAAGRHHMLVAGPPAEARARARWLVELLPGLPADATMDLARIRSAAGLRPSVVPTRPPWREVAAPGSALALAGGAGALRPGDASLAHGGALLLDGVDRFDTAVLQLLAEPLRSRTVTVARGGVVAVLPADLQLVATAGDEPGAVRLPRWLADRLSIRVRVGDTGPQPGDEPDLGGPDVARARRAAAARGWPDNESIPGAALRRVAPLTPAAARLMEAAAGGGAVSTGAVRGVWRVALTLADLSGRPAIGHDEVERALLLRAVPRHPSRGAHRERPAPR
ncbi:MAG TPA: ATP-binding protein [Acidimicrobiales bacterium]|nr:ATP-binding protein [Acidimicrobiales bacterium]